jgi:hypothetical protein
MRLSASGNLEWSKTHAYTSKKYVLSLGGQVCGVSTKLELFKGVHCFTLTLSRSVEGYRDEDIEHEETGNHFESLVFGSTEKHEAKKWMTAIHEELHHRQSVDWFKSFSTLVTTRNRAARRVAIAPAPDMVTLAWLAELKVRDWDGEWQRCLSILSPLEKLASQRGHSHHKNNGNDEDEEEEAGIWESYKGHDEQAVLSGDKYDRPYIAEAVALKQKSDLFVQFHEFVRRVLQEITIVVRQKSCGDVSSIPKIMRELRNVKELELPDWLRAHGSLLSSDDEVPVEDTVLFVIGGCCFELVSFSEAPDTARALSHGINGLQSLHRYCLSV